MKRNSNPVGKLPYEVERRIQHFQSHNPKALLCGSAALIHAGYLPYRPMHDIDFVMHYKDFDTDKNWRCNNHYAGEKGDGYNSYELHVNGNVINVLAFDDDIELRDVTIKNDYGVSIKCQRIDDILHWKRKYNRDKDKTDLKHIDKALDDAIFGG